MEKRFEVTVEGNPYARKSYDSLAEATRMGWLMDAKHGRKATIRDWYNSAMYQITGESEVAPLGKAEVRRPLGGYADHMGACLG